MHAIIVALILASPLQTSPSPSSSSETIDSVIVRMMRERKIPGVAVAIAENGRTVFERAYGVANLETGTPLKTDAVFELASVTKQFTAAAIMMLVEDGRVKLDDPITAHIDNAPASWQAITVRNLLNHTGGFDINGLPRHDGSAHMIITTKSTFDFLVAQPLRAPPDRDGFYSDAGYFLLGMIIEKASGMKYREFMQKRVFEPNGMTRTSITDRQRVIPGRVATYSLRDGEWINWRRDWDHELPSFFGVWSTLQDVAKWDAALRAGTALRPSSLEQMWTPGRLSNGQAVRVLDSYYGFGWEVGDLRGRRFAGHSGASGTYLLHFLDEPLTIVVLTNLDTPSGRRHNKQLARMVAGAFRPAHAPAMMLDPQRDPDPQFTAAASGLLQALAARTESPLMSDAYRAWYAASPGYRAVYANQLSSLGPLTHLATDDVTGTKFFEPDALTRLVHYRVDGSARTFWVTLGLTRDGKVGKFEIDG